MIAIGHTQLQMGTDLQFVPVWFFQSNDTESKDHMMCSHWSIPYHASFCLGSAEYTGINQRECFYSMLDQIGIAFSKCVPFVTELHIGVDILHKLLQQSAH
jgi:hypothetical protein